MSKKSKSFGEALDAIRAALGKDTEKVAIALTKANDTLKGAYDVLNTIIGRVNDIEDINYSLRIIAGREVNSSWMREFAKDIGVNAMPKEWLEICDLDGYVAVLGKINREPDLLKRLFAYRQMLATANNLRAAVEDKRDTIAHKTANVSGRNANEIEVVKRKLARYDENIAAIDERRAVVLVKWFECRYKIEQRVLGETQMVMPQVHDGEVAAARVKYSLKAIFQAIINQGE